MSSLNPVDKSVLEILKLKDFTISAEVIPPRNGEDQTNIFNQIDKLVNAGVDFLSVTKGAGGSLRGGSLPIAMAIKDRFQKPCIAHFTCRDLLPEEVENQLIDHHYFGIRNILALRGDPPQGVESWLPRDGGYSYAYELIEQVKKLNSGIYKKRQGFDTKTAKPTQFSIGCAVYPEHSDPQERINFFKHKVDAGAEWAISQMIFDVKVFNDFRSLTIKNQIDIPILPGLRLLSSKKQALNMKKRFGCSIPVQYFNSLPEQYSLAEENRVLDAFIDLINQFRDIGIPGVHIFVLTDTDLVSKAINIASVLRS